MDNRTREAIGAALCQRGPRRGQLKVSPPKYGTDGYIAWNAIQTVVNPFKVSMGALLFLTEEQQALAEECKAWIRSVPSLQRVLDRDRKALESLGVW